MMIFSRLEGEVPDSAVTALAVLAYNLSLNLQSVLDGGAAEVLIGISFKLMRINTVELYVYGLRIFSQLIKTQMPGSDFIQLLTYMEKVFR